MNGVNERSDIVDMGALRVAGSGGRSQDLSLFKYMILTLISISYSRRGAPVAAPRALGSVGLRALEPGEGAAARLGGAKRGTVLK